MTRLDPQDARQGKKDKPVLKVLISALALCVVVALVLVIYSWAMPDATLSSTSSDPSGASTSAPVKTDGTTTPTPAN